MAFDGVVKVLCEWIVDDAHERYEVMRKSERNGNIGESMDEVGGAIDGIADECWSGSQKGGGWRWR